MALYFFHFFDGESFFSDETGVEFPSAEIAYLEAVKSAREMWGELLTTRRDPRRCHFAIEDANGNDLFNLPFSELLEN